MWEIGEFEEMMDYYLVDNGADALEFHCMCAEEVRRMEKRGLVPTERAFHYMTFYVIMQRLPDNIQELDAFWEYLDKRNKDIAT